MTHQPRADQEGTSSGPRRRDESGVVLAFFALSVLSLLGIAALVVDFGYWSLRAEQMQRAADAAALSGVAYMPNFTKAEAVADKVAGDNGFTASTVAVSVPSLNGQPQDDELAVQITDSKVPTFFAKVFGLDSITEVRSSTAKYDQPVPLGSPEDSLGTGNLSCSGSGATCESEANYWLAISGYCTAREDGDEFSSAYDGNHASSGTVCPTLPLTSPNFKNVDYDPNGYVYDFDVPAASGTSTTGENVTVEIYDPSYDPPITNNNCGTTTAGSPAGDESLMACNVPTTITTNWLLYGPGNGVYDPSLDPILAPPGGSRSNPGIFASGDTTCEGKWCSLYFIPAGSQAGNYYLNLWTTAGQSNSAGTNQFALRALVGQGPTGCGTLQSYVCTSASVDTGTFAPCSTIAEGSLPANAQCPEVHGDTAMSIYVNSAGTATCTTSVARQEQSAQGQPVNSVTAAEPCASFYLAQVSPSYSGKTMTITLFDPGEGATGIELLQPDGSLASFTYQTVDTYGTVGSDDGQYTTNPPYYSDDGNNPPKTTTQCICNPGLKPGPLFGRASPSEYNDRYLEIQTTLPSATVLDQNGGWYKVEYVFNGSSVSDRTTWNVSVGGNPIHLTN